MNQRGGRKRAPEGHSKIAQQFTAGNGVAKNPGRKVPEGRQSIARGVSPWGSIQNRCSKAPKGRQ